MGHIAEPKDVDLNIKSKPLTDKERKEISELIKKLKEKNKGDSIDRKSKKRKKDFSDKD